MGYFIFNNHSLETTLHKDLLEEIIADFFSIYREAEKLNFNICYISDQLDKNWYQIVIGNNYTIREWIDNRDDSDYRRLLKRLIESTKQISLKNAVSSFEEKNTIHEFMLNGKEVLTLGVVYLWKKTAVSLNTEICWSSDSLSFTHTKLREDMECTEDNIQVKNISTQEHLDFFYKDFINQKKKTILSYSDRLKLIDHYENIILIPKAKSQIRKIDQSFFGQIIDAFASINSAVDECNELSYNNLISNCRNLKISDESESVKNNPKLSRHRSFLYQEFRYYFFYHIKNFSGFKRVHFIIKNKKVIIGYIGPHLPL